MRYQVAFALVNEHGILLETIRRLEREVREITVYNDWIEQGYKIRKIQISPVDDGKWAPTE